MSNIEDSEARGTMIFAWWMACLSDAYRSVYYRRKPMLSVLICSLSPLNVVVDSWACGDLYRDDDDYDIDFYTVGPATPSEIVEAAQPSPSIREQLEVRTRRYIPYSSSQISSYVPAMHSSW